MSDARWALIEPMLNQWRAARGRLAISEYYYFALWRDDGTIEHIHDVLRDQVREAAGRKAQPSAAILDAQSVKTSSNVPESSQGIDAGKKIKGRKRHIAIDTLGLLLVVLVTSASVQGQCRWDQRH